MIEAMPGATPDPTLATLVPQPSRGRAAALTALAVVLLAAVWFAAPVLRPTLTQDATSHRSSAKDAPVSLYEISTAGPLTVERVTGTEAAEVAGAWLLPDVDGRHGLTDVHSPDSTPEDLLRASGIDPDAVALPQSLAAGETAWLMVAWRPAGCPVVDMTSWGDVTVRSPLGVERTQDLAGGGPLYPADTVVDPTCP